MDTQNRFDLTVCWRLLSVEKESAFVVYLKEAGHRVEMIDDEPSRVPDRGCVVMCGNAAWFPRVRRRLLAMSPKERPLVVIWHTEPLPPPDSAGARWPMLNLREVAKILLRDARASDVYTNYFILRQLAKKGLPDILVVSGRGRQDFLAERGIQSHFAPLGYSEDIGWDLGLERDVDVLFLGSLDVPRRNQLLKTLQRQSISVTQVGSWFDPAFWGENRTRLLNRAKILLNFARTPGEFSGYRLLLGMANKALVISEPIYKPDPYVPGKHFIMTAMAEMPDRIRYYLANEEERRQITDVAYPFALQEATLKRSAGRVMGLIGEWEQNGHRHA